MHKSSSMKPLEKTTEEPQKTNLEHTDSQITKVLVKNLRVGLVKLAQQVFSLFGRYLAIQVNTLEQIPQFLLGGVLSGVSVCSPRHLLAEHGTLKTRREN